MRLAYAMAQAWHRAAVTSWTGRDLSRMPHHLENAKYVYSGTPLYGHP